MTNTPLISVILAAYNAERYIALAVESILTQTLQDFEFLITDDGSTDQTLKFLQAYASQDNRVYLNWHSNQGVPKTRNQLLSQARGKFIAVMDADDIAHPERFALQVAFLQNHPDHVCVGASHHLIDHRGRFLTYLHLPEQDEDVQRAALAGHGSICHPCAMVCRSAFLAVGGYDETLHSAHDLDLWLKLGEVGKLANLSEPLLQYRILVNSVSGSNPSAQRQEARIACERAWQRRGIEGVFEATQPWRPGNDRDSQHCFMLQYGWWAFGSCQRQTAMIYALKAIQILPWKQEGWKLLACALIRSPHLPNELRGKERDSTSITSS